MADTKRAVSLIALIVLTLFVGDRLLYWTGLTAISRSSERFVRLYNHRYVADSILIVGNSRADEHFPAQALAGKLGTPVVNLGLGGEATVVSELLVRDYLEANPRPSVIVVEVSNVIEDPKEIGDFGFLANYSGRFSELRQRDSPSFHRWAMVFKLLNLNSRMLFRALYGLLRPEHDRLLVREVTDETLEIFRRREPRKPESQAENMAALARLNELSKTTGIPVRFVLSPYLMLSRVRSEQISDWVSELEQSVEGIEIDSYADLVDDPSCFMDSLHLNAKGVEIYVKRLIDEGIFSRQRSTGG